ncbi:MAG TPA: F0F1 ATP synthase subunit A, partial [Puia sp.]|nr:F0F1 ATP synthase subunit A [Puia sp.]
MTSKSFKSILVAGFSLFGLLLTNLSYGQHEKGEKKPQKLDPAKIIMEHVSDGHEFHFATVGGHHVTIPLPVILYSPSRGLSVFMSSAFEHGEQEHDGYRLLEDRFLEEQGLDSAKNAKGQPLYKTGKIYAVDQNGIPDLSVKVFDFSITRNVAQTLISVLILIWIMTTVAKMYAKGRGTISAPKGFQNALEPVITFIRDEVGKPNLGSKYERYMPFLLTVFFFILINNLIGLIPGSANVTGNIAFTGFLGIISFIVILFSTNKHFWGHIFNPPVPMGVKPIMIPVEILGI